MPQIEFKFAPHQYVTVHAHGLDFSARVIRCVHTGGLQNAYDCDYAANAEVKRGEFYEDELVAK